MVLMCVCAYLDPCGAGFFRNRAQHGFWFLGQRGILCCE